MPSSGSRTKTAIGGVRTSTALRGSTATGNDREGGVGALRIGAMDQPRTLRRWHGGDEARLQKHVPSIIIISTQARTCCVLRSVLAGSLSVWGDG